MEDQALIFETLEDFAICFEQYMAHVAFLAIQYAWYWTTVLSTTIFKGCLPKGLVRLATRRLVHMVS